MIPHMMIRSNQNNNFLGLGGGLNKLIFSYFKRIFIPLFFRQHQLWFNSEIELISLCLDQNNFLFIAKLGCTMNKIGSNSGHFQKRTQIQLSQLGRITKKLPGLINLGDFGSRCVFLRFWSDITILLVYFSIFLKKSRF